MAAERNALRVGMMTLVCVATAFVILLWLSKGVGGQMRTLKIQFKCDPNMPTLAPGSSVLVGGQKVGRVIKAELARNEKAGPQAPPSEAYVVIIETEIQDFIDLRKDCQVFAEGPPLGGDGLIKIDLGKDERILPTDVVVLGSPPAGFGAILGSLQSELDTTDPNSLLARIKTQLDPGARASLMNRLLASMDDLNKMTTALRSQMSPDERNSLMAKLHGTMDNVAGATGALRDEMDPARPTGLIGKAHVAADAVTGGLKTVARVLETNEAPINKTIGHVASTAEKLDTRIAENIASQTDPNNLDGLIARINKAAAQLNQSLADVNTLTGTTREVVVLNRENINKTLINFKETSDHLKSAVKYVLERPWRLINPPSATEDRQHAIFDAARNFSEAANRLDDATAQLKALAELHNGNIPADNADLVRLKADLEATRARFSKAEEVLWRELGVK